MIGNHAIPVDRRGLCQGLSRLRRQALRRARQHACRTATTWKSTAAGYVAPCTDKIAPRGACDNQNQSVSRTLEYAYDDCLHGAAWPQLLGKARRAKLFAARAENWRNVFDPAKRLHARQEGRRQVGRAVRPAAITFDEYTEANAWQYNFFVPHELPGLIAAHGRRRRHSSRKLDKMFTDDTPICRPRRPT